MSEIVSKIKYAMSLRTPQEEALSYLDAISSHCDYKKDSKDVVEAATPKTTSNVIYAYDLARGAVEGYLKIPIEKKFKKIF